MSGGHSREGTAKRREGWITNGQDFKLKAERVSTMSGGHSREGTAKRREG